MLKETEETSIFCHIFIIGFISISSLLPLNPLAAPMQIYVRLRLRLKFNKSIDTSYNS